MIIVFWSNIHGQCGNSTNAGLISLLLSKRKDCKGVMFQIGNEMNRPELLFGLGSNEKKETTDMELGLEALLMGIRAGRCDNRFIESCCVDIGKTGLRILSGPENNSFDFYNAAFIENVNELISRLEAAYGIVYIDIGLSNDGWCSNSIVESVVKRADIEIISLCQNIHILERFLKNNIYNSSEKSFYIIGQYQDNLKWNYHNLKRHYKFLTSKNSGIIPYEQKIRDAFCARGLADLLDSYDSDSELEDSFFLRNLYSIAEKISLIIEKRRTEIEA